MSKLDDARGRLETFLSKTTVKEMGVHTVTFQPDLNRINEDRFVTEEWEILGQKWLFLAVCDGTNIHLRRASAKPHMFCTSSRSWRHHDIQLHCDKLARSMAQSTCLPHPSRVAWNLDRQNIQEADAIIGAMVRNEIEAFDDSIGRAVKHLCPHPSKITEPQAHALIDKHAEVLQRAWCGSTLAISLINVTHQLMWSIGVGDSTVGEQYSCTVIYSFSDQPGYI